MRAPGRLPDEALRLKAVWRYRLKESAPDPDLDELTQLARAICEVPAACICIVEENHQWLLSCEGIAGRRAPCPAGFWVQVISQKELVVVEDGHPSSPYRFQAAMPLLTPEGVALGALTVVDTRPRTLSALQRQSLETLARQVMAQLELKRESRERAVSEARLRLVTDSARVGLVAYDRDCRYVYCNRSYAQMMNMESEDLLGRTPSDFLPAECCEGIRRRVELAFAGQGSLDEINGPMPHLHSVVHYQPAEELVVSVLVDVTDRHRAEERTRFALHNAGVGIWDSQLASGKTRWSEVLEAQYGFEPGTFSGEIADFLARLHPDDQPSFHNRYAQGDQFDILLRALWPNGTVRWLRSQGKLYRDQYGQPVRSLGISQDITEQIQLEEQVRQSQKMEAVGRLAGGVAHDFNNLLTVILGFVEVLRAELGEADPRLVHLDDIEQAADSATAVVRQLLAFSRKQNIEPRELDLNHILRGLQSMLARLIPEDVMIALDLAAEPLQVQADRAQIEQVVLNLAVNARDAMPMGGRLTLATRRDDEWVHLSVRDSGGGIPPEVLDRLFEPFFTTKEIGHGTGLGLATVHGIVNQSGGTIRVFNRPEGGACFEVSLPRFRPLPGGCP